MSDQEQYNMTPGAMLRMARERCGKSQADIAARMRLSAQVIIDIEQDDYAHMPAKIYMRGYLRSFAGHVGLDGDAVIKAFESLDIPEPTDQSHIATLKQSPISETTATRQIPWRMIGAALFALLVIIALWIWSSQRVPAPIAVKAPATTVVTKPVLPIQTAPVIANPVAKPVVAKQVVQVQPKKPAKKIKPQPAKTTALKPNYKLIPADNNE